MVGNLKIHQRVTGILLLREKIEHVLDISNAVDMAVYVNIAVIGGNDTRGFGFLHPDARIVGNLAYLFVINPLGESAVGEIPIGHAVAQHFEDIGQDPTLTDVTVKKFTVVADYDSRAVKGEDSFLQHLFRGDVKMVGRLVED